MGQAKPTTTAALLRRLALPAVFVAVICYTQLKNNSPATAEVAAQSDISAAVITELSGPTMGTTFTVKVRGPEMDSEASEILSQAITGALDEVNESMSTWLKTSELSRFNDGPAHSPFKFSAPTMELLAISQEVYAASDGSFDVTVGPLVNRWGFGPTDPKGPPSESEIAALRQIVGQDKLIISTDEATVTKPHPKLRMNFSAVAKGYAVDRVALALEDLGHLSYMVEVGGEIRTGTSGNSAPWRIAVERPDLPTINTLGQHYDPGVFEVLELLNIAMATSGDYRNFFMDEGTLRSHTIDPRTGVPVTHALASVTVLHEQCAMADAWATALMVLGPDAGLALAEREGLAAMFVSRGQDELKRSATSAFSEFSQLVESGSAQ